MTMSWLSFSVFLLISLATNFAFGEEPVGSYLQASTQEMAQAQDEYEVAMGRKQTLTPAAAIAKDSATPAPTNFSIALRSADNSNADKH